ncbi:ribonucleases P/MRP protein subunit POP1-domain-containing protein [Podospora aff. communis PSN243]|uniref:Ribonucleases P/MRP protein subunit POP1-domain-containing protein n=1 Tax=Podospora aff. communis PSN243 TaxID=3040156 RepID=A0AAV9H1T1_9PEZI|nr:ribonucleases P/MRP protein subunit POP1-domain-containing protein [Podospora aff. communis PSN243]
MCPPPPAQPVHVVPQPRRNVQRLNSKRASGGKPPETKKRKDAPAETNSQQTRPNNSRANKRVKFQDARNIRSQPPDAAMENGHLDLEKFLKARHFEIGALEASMQKCKDVNATRVFQQVPRAMRRRTASHNAKRVPKRLRERARREMIEDNTPTVESRRRRPRTTRARIRAETAKKLGILAAKQRKKRLEKAAVEGGGSSTAPETIQSRAPRPKIRRNALNDAPKPTSKYGKRQVNKKWLPTHLWHAKRARMTEPGKPLWKFAIPLTPNEKCYRATHRASGQRGAVVWDTSYMSTIGLYGLAEGAQRVLRALGLTQEALWGNRGQKWRAGVRKWTGILSKQRKEGRRNIGPATIMWNTVMPVEEDGGAEACESTGLQRQLLIRTHPACFLELFDELKKLVKMQTPQMHVEDLRSQVGSIEIVGPGSTEALIGILKPYYNTVEVEGCQGRIFKSLAGVTNPSSLPKDATLSFSIRDPRLSYPPEKVRLPSGIDQSLLETLTNWPIEEGLKPSGLYDRNVRHKASGLPSQKSINRRKGFNLPGKELGVTNADPPIPVMLLASRPGLAGQAQGTWTLLAPWKCILPIWYSLMHYPLSTGEKPRLGGLDQQRQVALEQGSPWFPGDFPGTDAGVDWELQSREKRKAAWDRRPKSKRVEWKSLDLGGGRRGEVGDGLACDFEHLFGLSRAGEIGAQVMGSSAGDDPDLMELDRPDGNDGVLSSKAPHPLATITHITKSGFNGIASAQNSIKPPRRSIVTVSLSFVGRGVANTCARIYRLPAPSEPSTQAEVPATDPPTNPNTLPHNIREQWLRNLPLQTTTGNPTTRDQGRPGGKHPPAPPRMPPDADFQTRKRLLGASSDTGGAPLCIDFEGWRGLPGFKATANQTDIGGHPLCPGEEDLIGFVTTGSFCLSEGKGTAVGSISAEKAVECIEGFGTEEGKLCIVRNAGESVGWLARWELV